LDCIEMKRIKRVFPVSFYFNLEISYSLLEFGGKIPF
jgi:hypothetical protein